MENYGFIKVATAVPKLKVANPTFNANEIYTLIKEANDEDVKILVTPELSISAYTCADLFFQDTLLDKAESALKTLVEKTKDMDIFTVVGLPIRYKNALYNCAVAFLRGEILGVIPKEYIPTHNEFYEKRWFASGRDIVYENISIANQEVPFGQMLFNLSNNITIGIEICEDLWVPIAPSSKLALSGANIILNLSASNEVVSKDKYRTDLIVSQSAKCIAAYVYVSAGVHESTTDILFGGSSIIAENGTLINKGKRFLRESTLNTAFIDVEKLNFQRRQNISFNDNKSLYNEQYCEIDCSFESIKLTNFNRFIDPHPFVPNNEDSRTERCNEIFSIQASALAKRLEHIGLKKLVVGISGGLDSTLALLVAVETMKLLNLPNSNIIGITMPGFGTTDRTYNNAIALMKSLDVTIKEISIKEAATLHMNDIEHDINHHDITYENTQARERTQILMDMANKHGAILVGTGDLSEMALGWCTYNADHMSMYGVNASVPKTLVSHVVRSVALDSDTNTKNILMDILDTPISPELLPPTKDGKIAQKTEDNIGPYELHDFFLYNYIRLGTGKNKLKFLTKEAFKDKYSDEIIEKWLNNFFRRFFISQFKRSCTPDAPKVGSVSLSPRGDWRMPSDADFSEWLND